MGIIGIYDTLDNRVSNHIAGGKLGEADLFHIFQHLTKVHKDMVSRPTG